mgnify:FL=1
MKDTPKKDNPLFKMGDKVRVINYGALLWDRNGKLPFKKMKLSTDEVYLYDIMPELVGKEGIVDKVSVTQGIVGYALNNIPEKYAWYHEDQLTLVE